ncbi:hypothetical protein KAS08_02300 [Candidatus Pacearchaeota archaeon]|nr:hypothetical protein [Candidatus Pacearchaeota archaeon]
MKKEEKIFLYVIIPSFVIYFLLAWIKKDLLINFSKNTFSTLLVWMMSITISPMLPGILNSGGDGFEKVRWSHLFQTKEKGFLFFMIDLILVVGVIALIKTGLTKFFSFVPLFLIPVSVSWILFCYLYYMKINNYKFPHFYFWITLVLISLSSMGIYLLAYN